MADVTAQGGRSRNNTTRAIVIVGSLIIVALVGVIVALVMNLNRAEPAPVVDENLPPQRDFLITEETSDEVYQEIVSAPVDVPYYYEVRMDTEWNFPDGTSVSPDAYVENADSNSTNVYFDVELSDTGETIYESPVIPLGASLREIKLNKDLDAGHYDAVVIYHLIDGQQRTLSTVRVALEINVES